MVRKSSVSSGRKETEALKRQMNCSHLEEPAKEIITRRGRTVIVNALRCAKCEVVSVVPEEVERARKELNPSFLHRCKEFFGAVEEGAEALVFRGKVL